MCIWGKRAQGWVEYSCEWRSGQWAPAIASSLRVNECTGKGGKKAQGRLSYHAFAHHHQAKHQLHTAGAVTGICLARMAAPRANRLAGERGFGRGWWARDVGAEWGLLAGLCGKDWGSWFSMVFTIRKELPQEKPRKVLGVRRQGDSRSKENGEAKEWGKECVGWKGKRPFLAKK